MSSTLEGDLAWSSVRAETIDRFAGELPRADNEAAIIEAFELSPRAVMRTIDEVAEAVKRGDVRSGWGVLAKRVQGASGPIREATVKGVDERAKRIRHAEAWIARAGGHFDREDELVDALFESGSEVDLRPWADDQPLRRRLVSLWEEAREHVVAMEQDDERRRVEARARKLELENRLRQEKLKLDECQTVTDDEPEPSLA